MNEQYVTLVGKVCAPRYEEVYTPEVKSKLPIEASSEGRKLKDYTIYGNNNPNHVDESQSILPISIDTYGGNATDWEIYGNNNPVIETESNTLPIDISSSGGNAIDYTIYGNDDNGTENLITDIIANCGINDTGTLVSSTAWQMFCAKIKNGQQYTIVSDNVVYGFYLTKPEINATAYDSTRYAPGGTTKTFTSDIDGWIAIRLAAAQSDVVMLVKGSTAPDHYIPYQKGVGENTEITGELPIDFRSNGDDLLGYKIYGTADGAGEMENLFNKNAPYTPNYFLTSDGAENRGTDWGISDYIAIDGGMSYTAYNLIGNRTACCWYDENYEYISGERYRDETEKTFNLPSNARYVRITFKQTDPSNVDILMLIKGTISPSEYISYGYKIPLTVSGTETKTTNIYIGDSKLGEAEYVDYGEQKIYRRILFMTHDDKHFITKDNKDFCLRRGYSG